MDIKLIAVDMDGTFLSGGNHYNKERFEHIYQRLMDQDIQFVVASGNQYYSISSFFDHENIWYAAENGAWIKNAKEELFVASMDVTKALALIDVLKEHEGVYICVCGKDSAYVEDDRLLPMITPCFPHIQVISDFHCIDDHIFKLALLTPPEKTQALYEIILKIIPEEMNAVLSGFGCIDINMEGIHKGSAIRTICDHLNIPLNQCMAFGDSGNDIEMLECVGYGYAMENASDEVKGKVKYIAPACSDEGVLDIIEQYLARAL